MRVGRASSCRRLQIHRSTPRSQASAGLAALALLAGLLGAPLFGGSAAESPPESPAASPAASPAEAPAEAARRGFDLLVNKPLSRSLFSISELERLYTVWEPEAHERAAAASPAERRRMTFERYGLVSRSFDDSGLPLGYTADPEGRLYPNCLSCHGGKVAGRSIPGLPNTHQDLTALAQDLAELRALEQGRDPVAARRSATLGYPLNFYKGLTNATMFSIILGAMRDEHLELRFPSLTQALVHNDVDAPPWWHFRKKERIYWDGMAPKTDRTLMQFTMAPGVTGAQIRSWEDDFHYIKAYIESLEPPPWPWEVDRELAARGEATFERTCARCHGSYGEHPSYRQRAVPLDELGTDPLRLGAIARESKEKYNRSWFSNYGEHPVTLEPDGYVAPPLDGIWASAPYLHNGSVPTLHHLLHPSERPAVWRRSEDGYDRTRVGLEVEELENVPQAISERLARTYYDTALPSHSAAGHEYPELLSEDEKRAVLEYLKTL